MTLTHLLLILGSALLHVISHVAMKRAQDRTAFIWWMWMWAVIIFAPIPFLLWQPVSAKVWIVLIVSAIFEALYFSSIARAYKTGDLSIVYPLARGTAPLFILIWSSVWLRERPSVGGFIGIALITLGLCAVNSNSGWRQSLKALSQPAPRWALLAGLFISLYTTVDKVGVGMLYPLLYTYLVMTMTVVMLTPETLLSVGWRGLARELRSSGWSSVLSGLVAIAAYAIVLYAMQDGMSASYAGATREISVVFGAIIGIVFLKESGTFVRIIGAILITFGVGTIAIFG